MWFEPQPSLNRSPYAYPCRTPFRAHAVSTTKTRGLPIRQLPPIKRSSSSSTTPGSQTRGQMLEDHPAAPSSPTRPSADIDRIRRQRTDRLKSSRHGENRAVQIHQQSLPLPVKHANPPSDQGEAGRQDKFDIQLSKERVAQSRTPVQSRHIPCRQRKHDFQPNFPSLSDRSPVYADSDQLAVA